VHSLSTEHLSILARTRRGVCVLLIFGASNQDHSVNEEKSPLQLYALSSLPAILPPPSMSSLSVFGSIFGSRFLTMNLETRAYLIDTLARAPLYISILFLGTVFMQYANLHAGCTKDGFDIAPGQSTADAMAAEVECLGKAYGLKPSSILTTLNTGAGLIVA